MLSADSNRKLGIIAGDGKLPMLIDQHCEEHNIDCSFSFINTEPDFNINSNYIVAGIGQVGKILSFFKKQKVTHVILAGGVRKPNLYDVKVDFKGSILLAKILKNKFLGDNSLLSTIITYLESFGYMILSVDELLPELHLGIGNNNNISFNQILESDIKLGVNLINTLADFDIGQAAIIQNGRVISVEAAEGTDNMIVRTRKYIEKNDKHPAILVKLKKYSQDRRIDLPTIGVKTIKNLIDSNIKGIVLDAANTIVIDKIKVLKYAEENKIFIYGVHSN